MNNKKIGTVILVVLINIAFLYIVYIIGTQRTNIIINWTTASEIDTAGFNVLRSVTSDGDYVRVNTELIPASQDPLTGSEYSYTDSNLIQGQTYFYYLEDVDNQGSIMTHGPIEIKAEEQNRLIFPLILVLILADTGIIFILWGKWKHKSVLNLPGGIL